MKLNEVLAKFDTLDRKTFDVHDVTAALKTLVPDKKELVESELKAELLAFDFTGGSEERENGWGTYFGPMIVYGNEDGTLTEYPSIELVTPGMIEYWEKRAIEATNPILKSRYSGLVWDFKHKITGERPSHEICRLNINALIETANGGYNKHFLLTFIELKRALSLAMSLNDNELIEIIKRTVIDLENRHAQDDKPGLWGHAFDLLVGKVKVNLTEEEETSIIQELESRLTRLTGADAEEHEIDPWSAEAAAKRLATYYRSHQKKEDVNRVILKVGEAYSKIMDNASAVQTYGWLDHLYKLYVQFNLVEEAKELLLNMREIGEKATSELHKISHSIEISNDEIKKYVSDMTNGSPEEIIIRFAALYIPRREEIEKQVFELSKKAPLVYIISQQLQDEKGRILATIGSLENDLEGHLVRQVSQNLSLSAFFVREVLNYAISDKGLSKSIILDFVSKSPIINPGRIGVIEKALDAYFQSDFLTFIHLIIPQIEEAIRNLVEMGGGNVLKPSRGGGFHLKTFDEVLRDDVTIESLGEDFSSYFRILFTDQRGWNLRNDVCHGIANPNIFNSQTADRILHALVCLGLIEKR